MNLKFRSESKISEPKISLGIKSGVNWMRLKLRPSAFATVCTISVFASPGTPTSKTCPPEKIAQMISSTTCSCPTITFCTWVFNFLYS